MKTVYLDNAATTKVDKKVTKEMNNCYFNCYGNPSSIHHMGQQAKDLLEDSRRIIADNLNAFSEQIIFTSGGTESNNMVIKSFDDVIVSEIEHDSVLNAALNAKKINVDSKGLLCIKELECAITDKTELVSVMHVNNEIGVVQNIKKIYSICKKRGVLFHTDACQSFTKVPLSCDDADIITINAHKIHGPKGVGAVCVNKRVKLKTFIYGGGQESRMRSGTENLPGIIGFAKACTIDPKINSVQQMRDYFFERLKEIPNILFNGHMKKRVCNNVNLSFAGVEGESIIAMLDTYGICASTGSACSSKSLSPSHVIMALQDNPVRAHGSVRFSLSKNNSKKEIDYVIKILKKIIPKLRRMSAIGV